MYQLEVEKINNRLESDFHYVENKGYKVLGVFLQGSQNYQLSYEGSDIDTKAIVIPTLDDIIFNRKPASTTIVLPSNEHIDVKDIRLMHECFKKQNINFIEILFTSFKFLNPYYKDAYQPMFDNNESIAHMNEIAAINCMVGMVYEKYKALTHPYPATKEKIDKYGYDPKQLHHILRVVDFLRDYTSGVPYKDCLVAPEPKRREFLINVKKCPPLYNLEEAEKIANQKLEEVSNIKNKMLEKAKGFNAEANDLMNKCQSEVIKLAIKKDLELEK